MNDFSVTISFLQLLIGIYIHVKKMKVAKIKKEITWELEIYYSLACVIYFTLDTIIDAIKYTCPEMDQSIESLVVQVAWIFRTLGIAIISCHSFNVALYKYYIIVDKRPIYAEDKKLEFRYLLALILYPIIFALVLYLRNTNRMNVVFDATRFCYSEEVNLKVKKSMKELLICSFGDNDINRKEWPIIYVWSEVYCVISSIINFSLISNIVEIFVYYKIFKFAKR